MKMNLPTRRPDPPTIDALPEWTNLHEVVTKLTAERDAWLKCTEELGSEAERLAKERDEARCEVVDLKARSLPYLDSVEWPTAEPVDALCYDELAERLDFMPDLRTDGDDVDWAEQIRRFGDAVACENPDPRAEITTGEPT